MPETLQRVADQAIQLHGAMGVCADTPLTSIWAAARVLRLADGPDAVHWRKAGQLELLRQRENPLARLPYYSPPRGDGAPVFRRTADPVSAESAAAVEAFERVMG